MIYPVKSYYRMEFELVSPLAVGSGENAATDKDIMLDSAEKPYIPGTAMAGVYRKLLPGELEEDYFGAELETGDSLTESRVIVYDAVLPGSEKPFTTKRDMVALDAFKTAVPGAKFDFQILEPGVRFVTYAEENLEEGEDGVMKQILAAWLWSPVRIGAKTQRGYGSAKLCSVRTAFFHTGVSKDRTEKSQGEKEAPALPERTAAAKLPDGMLGVNDWLDFHLFEEPKPGNRFWTVLYDEEGNIRRLAAKPAFEEGRLRLCLRLKQRGGISIRQYSTRIKEADYIQMKLHDERKDGKVIREGSPVIPGTGWAGAFRSQMTKLGLTPEEAEAFFGTKKGENSGRRSLISFSESYLTGTASVQYSHNKIDRFSGGTIDGALYTEQTCYNGTTELEIGLDCRRADPRKLGRFLQILAAAILDLHNGYLAVGGLTSIGRGMFLIERLTVNGEALESVAYPQLYRSMRDHACQKADGEPAGKREKEAEG